MNVIIIITLLLLHNWLCSTSHDRLSLHGLQLTFPFAEYAKTSHSSAMMGECKLVQEVGHWASGCIRSLLYTNYTGPHFTSTPLEDSNPMYDIQSKCVF